MGAVIYFLGVVRGSEGEKNISAIEYEAFQKMVEHQFHLLFDAMEKRWPIESVRLVHRIGVIGVSTGIWDKPGPLSASEWERVRTVPYLTERVLCRHPQLAEIATIAAMSHERLDGRGYPRGLTGSAIPPAARLLAAAAVYQALAEARPYRGALPLAERKAMLLAEVARVLRPGGLFAGTDNLGTGLLFRLLHIGDTLVRVPPDGLPRRLQTVGLDRSEIRRAKRSFRFRALKPA